MDTYEMEIARNDLMRDIDIAKNNVLRIIAAYISLDDRSYDILKCRAKKVIRKKLGIKYKISANRIMQIEASAIREILQSSGIREELNDKYKELLTAQANKYKVDKTEDRRAEEIRLKKTEARRAEEIRLKIKYMMPLSGLE